MNTLIRGLGWLAATLGAVLLGWGLWPSPQHTFTTEIGGARLAFTVPTALRLDDAPVARLEVFPKATPSPGQEPRLAVRLTFNGVEVVPPGEVALTVGQDAPARFTWRLRAQASGSALGSFWVYQIFPDGSRLARLTYPLHLRVRTFLGLNGAEARLLGLFAVFVAAVLAFAARR